MWCSVSLSKLSISISNFTAFFLQNIVFSAVVGCLNQDLLMTGLPPPFLLTTSLKSQYYACTAITKLTVNFTPSDATDSKYEYYKPRKISVENCRSECVTPY